MEISHAYKYNTMTQGMHFGDGNHYKIKPCKNTAGIKGVIPFPSMQAHEFFQQTSFLFDFVLL
jgi:hypothetical protein